MEGLYVWVYEQEREGITFLNRCFVSSCQSKGLSGKFISFREYWIFQKLAPICEVTASLV